MNKSELIGSIAELSGLTKVDAEKALTAFIKMQFQAKNDK